MQQPYDRDNCFKQLKALFEFDEKGILRPMAKGMAGPIGLPMGYLDMSYVTTEEKTFKDFLILTWYEQNVAQIINGKNTRDATDEELYYALNYYQKAVENFCQEMVEKLTENGKELSTYWKSRLGIIPYFDNLKI